MEMRAKDNKAKASDPIDDFIVLKDRSLWLERCKGTPYLSTRMYTECV